MLKRIRWLEVKDVFLPEILHQYFYEKQGHYVSQSAGCFGIYSHFAADKFGVGYS